MRYRWFALLGMWILAGCTSVETVRLQPGNGTKVAATSLDEVEIFRSSTPEYNYDETELVTVKGTDPRVEDIYRHLRKEAAQHGANAVIRVKITTQQVQVPVTHTTCNGHGACFSSTSMRTELRYTAAGTLVRRKSK